MSTPTALDFARVYPAPMPAQFATEFEKLSEEDRVYAYDSAKRVAAGVRKFGVAPLGVLTFLSMKPWRMRVRMQMKTMEKA